MTQRKYARSAVLGMLMGSLLSGGLVFAADTKTSQETTPENR
jgi:hypothetical protein